MIVGCALIYNHFWLGFFIEFNHNPGQLMDHSCILIDGYFDQESSSNLTRILIEQWKIPCSSQNLFRPEFLIFFFQNLVDLWLNFTLWSKPFSTRVFDENSDRLMAYVYNLVETFFDQNFNHKFWLNMFLLFLNLLD